MNRDVISYNAQIENGVDFLNKVKLIFALLFVFLFNSLSGQDSKPEITTNPNAQITVVGEAFIYSKDATFNEQVSKNTELLKNSKVEYIETNELKIKARDKKNTSQPLTSTKKKTENIVLASKKGEKCSSIDIPKKEILLRVTNQDESDKLRAGGNSVNIQFIPPNNNCPSCKYFIVSYERSEAISFEFLSNIVYFYHNDSSKLQVIANDYSVRPPPVLA